MQNSFQLKLYKSLSDAYSPTKIDIYLHAYAYIRAVCVVRPDERGINLSRQLCSHALGTLVATDCVHAIARARVSDGRANRCTAAL